MRIAFTLKIAADEDFSTATSAGSIDLRVAEQAYPLAEYLDLATLPGLALRARRAGKVNIAMVTLHANIAAFGAIRDQGGRIRDLDIFLGNEAYTAIGITYDAGRIDLATVLQIAGE